MINDFDNGPRAWRFLKRNPAYAADWNTRNATAIEAASPIRTQTAADLDAAAWGLLAWQDPQAAERPASPFWANAPMLDARAARAGTPTLGTLAADGGADLSGLRLRDGRLVLKIERAGTAVQLVLAGGDGFDPDRDGLVLQLPFSLDLATALAALPLARASGSLSGAPPARDRELLTVLDAIQDGMPTREVATALYGADAVKTRWHPDCSLRTRTRRLIRQARALMDHGYRDLAARQ